MRPLPWILRLGLFAVGFGVGLSHYRAPWTKQPIVIEISVENPNSNFIVPASVPPTSVTQPRYRPPASSLEILPLPELTTRRAL
jgi:hypothetical protein